MTSGNNTTTITVDITGVENGKVPHSNPQPQGENVTVTLMCASDGANTGDVQATMSVLVGDATENGIVNSSDKSVVAGQIGIPVTAANFDKDITVSGDVSSADKSLTASRIGTALPPQ